jgi:hypothetical protein
VAEAVGEPGGGGEHAEIAEGAHGGADLLVLGEESPLGEEDGPVALLGADEGQGGGAGVGHVGADVGEILEEPEGAKSEGGGFALPEEIEAAQEGHEQFAQGSAENHDGVAEPTEEEMAAFVNDQIDVIEDEKSGAVSEGIEKEKGVEKEPGDSGEAGDGLPVAEFFLEECHWRKRSKVNPSTEVFWNMVLRVNDDGRAARLGGRTLRDRRFGVALIYACLVCGRKHLKRRLRVVLAHQQTKTSSGSCKVFPHAAGCIRLNHRIDTC